MTFRFVPLRSWRPLAAGCGLLAVLLPARASAEEQVELDWQAPPECPQQAVVQQKLRSLAGEAWRTTERVSAKGRIERIERRYRLTLSVRDGATVKERTIESDSCVDLGGAAAVTLGLLLGRGPNSGGPDGTQGSGTGTTGNGAAGQGGSDATTAGANSDRSSTAGAAAASKTTSSSTDAKSKPASEKDEDASADAGSASNRSDSESKRAWRALLRAPVLTLDLARLPKPSIGVGGGFGLRYAEWRFVAIGRILTDQTLWSEQFPDVGTRVSRAAAELSVCRGFRNGALEVAPCLTVGIDHLTARGEGPPNIVRHTQRSTAALIGGAGVVHFYLAEWMAVFAQAGVAVATASPTFTVDQLGEVGHVGPVQVSVGVGPEWIF